MATAWEERFIGFNTKPDVSLYVELDKPDAPYCPGDIIIATVRLVIHSRLEIAAIEAKLTVAETIEWYDNESGTTRHEHELFADRVRLVSAATYEPGEYEYKTKWVMPPVPPVFAFFPTACAAKLNAFVTSFVWVPPKKKKRFRHKPTQLQYKISHGKHLMLPPRKYSSRSLLVGKPYAGSQKCASKLLGIKVAPCEIGLSLESELWDVRQESIAIQLTMPTTCHDAVKNVSIALMEDAHFPTVQVWKHRSKKLFEECFIGGVAFDERGPGSFTATIQLRKPKDVYVYADIQSHVVTVTHRLRVKVQFRTLAVATAFFPIQIVM